MSLVTDTTYHENGIGVVVLGWQTTRAWIPAYAEMTVGVVGRLFSEESFMSLVTDTTYHENGIGVVVLGWQTTRAWIPAYAGMTVGVVGRLFSEE